ncbi:hypothetical protein PG984_006564 [Apiospora sp. TS-2023a]
MSFENYTELCRDDTFGPGVPPIVACRGGFDFTASSVLQLGATVFLAILSYWEHRSTVRPSFLVSAFLVLTAILDAARARTQALIGGQHVVASTLIAIVSVKLLLLIVENKDKTGILFPQYSGTSSELRSGLLSRAFFTWMLPLLGAGFKGIISSQDLPRIYEKLASETLTSRVESRWKNGGSKGAHALMMDTLLSFPKEISIILIATTMQVGLQICQPFLLQEMVAFLGDPTAPMTTGYGLLGGFFCYSLANALIIPWCFHYQFRLMIMARGVLVSMIYSKLLRSRANGVEQFSAFTLMTNDVEKIVDVWWRLLEPWYCLLQIGICTYLLYRQLGAICCVPILIILLTFTLVVLAGYKLPRQQDAWFQAIESRVDLTSHTLASLQSVKLLGLSGGMESRVQKKREHELQISQAFRVRNCLALTASFGPTILTPLVTFGAYAIMRMIQGEGSLTVETTVSSLAILNLISAPAKQLLLAIPLGLQAVGGFDRIQAYLQLDETLILTNDNSTKDTLAQETKDGVVLATLSVLPHLPHQLSGEDAQTAFFTPNTLTAITGPIGCGKSTLLRSLLLNAIPSEAIAYCQQTPWVHDGSIRDNIIGQSELDIPWYQAVIHSCELDVDIKGMPEGDATPVGSRGSRLSGGQRQRIAIARALYANTRRAIFDDVTSALDGRTMSAVAEKVFGRNGMLRKKGTSVVLATHAVPILQMTDRVLLMNKEGEVIDSGTYEELATRHENIVQRQAPVSETATESDSQNKDEGRLEEYQTQLDTRMDDVRRQKGDWKSYGLYIGSMGWLNSSVFVLGSVFAVAFQAISQVWVTWWASDTAGDHTLGYWLGLYATWAVLITLGIMLTPMAPLSFISNNGGIGPLVNRFSQDIRLCDWQLPFNILLTLMAFLSCLASILIAVAAVPYIAACIPVLAAVLILLQMFYLRTSRQLRLLEIESKAPVLSLFLDTMQGLTTIRAFGWSEAYVQRSFACLDPSQKPYYLLFCVQRWLLLVLALVVTGLEVLLAGLAIALRTKVSAGLVGLALIQVTTLTQGMSDLVMQWTEMETSLGAVSRISRFMQDTPQEEHLGEGETTPTEWPAEGSITFEDVDATYDPEPQGSSSLALNNIAFTVKSGEHVGICGRTGSGKSSLVAALSGLLPCHRGRILIDGVDISTLDPEVLRSKLNIITQEPFLFEGSVRENLNPWANETSDRDLLQALEQVDLHTKVKLLGGLDAPLHDTSLSHGQKQLFCLARALLRKSSVVILDEPTGSIDPATDATIQRLIKEMFRDRTVIMIAHRLQSLAQFDTIVVLDSGRLIETGQPLSLLNSPSSSFGALYRASEGGELDRDA